MSRGFHLWHSQLLDRVTPPWLARGGGGEGGMGVKNDPNAKRREWPPRKHCTEHMETMQARLTALEPND